MALVPPINKPITITPPLCERPAKFHVSLSELLDWRDTARIKSARLASRKVIDRDGRPSPTLKELTKELEWYLDDAVDGTWTQHCHGNVGVSLRASLQELTRGWDDRIERRRPLEYVVGCVRWRDLVLSVQEGVLIPRSETEQFVDLAKEALGNDSSLCYGAWADIGTGSGAIAIGVARLLGARTTGPAVVAVDCDDVALAVSRYNVSRCRLEGVVKVVKGSWFSPFKGKSNLAAVLSNPPYVPSASIRTMRAEACEHEPHYAMDGGREGTDHLFVVCDGASSVLRPGGFLALETDGGMQPHIVADYLAKSKLFNNIDVRRDYGGADRFVTAYRK